MAWTYATLKQAIQDYTQSSEPTYVTNIPFIVQQAEDRILNDAQLPNFRKNSTGTMTSGDQYLGTPTDFLAPYSLSISNTGQEFLIFKEVNFIREAYPASGTNGIPKYYGIFEDDFFIIGPTPNANFTTEIHYFYRPETIVTASTSWLGTNAESCLLYGCLIEAYTFLKGDADLMTLYTERYDIALNKLKLLAEGRSKTDAYRNG